MKFINNIPKKKRKNLPKMMQDFSSKSTRHNQFISEIIGQTINNQIIYYFDEFLQFSTDSKFLKLFQKFINYTFYEFCY